MPFDSITAKLHRGPGHRPKRRVVEEKKAASEIVRAILEADAESLARHFVKRSKKSDRVLTHAIDKILPNEQIDAQRPIIINFVKFDHTVQLQAEGVSATVLAGNGKGYQAIGEGVASPERQGQDGLKFLDFTDVPGERR